MVTEIFEPNVKPNIDGRPLITMFVMAYNQERFIREAVEGAFSQTYSPLEIILSDDCSTDRTFGIIKEMVADYKGSHHVVLNQNNSNLGIGGHVNHVMGLTQGELIVVAAGDDVSLPNRVEIIYSHWSNMGFPVCSLYSGFFTTDAEGAIISKCLEPCCASPTPKKIIEEWAAPNAGATNCWHRKVFDVFGKLNDDLIAEDAAIGFRMSFIGEIFYIKEALVKYRRHTGNLCGVVKGAYDHTHYKRMALIGSRMIDSLADQYIKDLQSDIAKQYLSTDMCDMLIRKCEEKQIIARIKQLSFTGTIIERLSLIRYMFYSKQACREYIKSLVKILFPRLYLNYLARQHQKTSADGL